MTQTFLCDYGITYPITAHVRAYLERRLEAKNTMGRSIREESKQYVEKKTRNISELASVDVDAEVFFKTAKKESGEEFSYEFILVDGEEYRMPASVKKHLKAILEKRPDLKRFSVIRSGTTKDDTVYTVMPLE